MTKSNAFTTPAKIDPAWLKRASHDHQKGLNGRKGSEASSYGRKLTAKYIDPRKKGEYL
jgi:hypothetical protein